MRKFLSLGLIFAALFFFSNTTLAQDKTTLAAVLQKLNEMDGKLNEMDKRYEIRFTRLEERFNRLEDKIAAVNQRIDDKFNLIVGLLGLIAAFLALPYNEYPGASITPLSPK